MAVRSGIVAAALLGGAVAFAVVVLLQPEGPPFECQAEPVMPVCRPMGAIPLWVSVLIAVIGAAIAGALAWFATRRLRG